MSNLLKINELSLIWSKLIAPDSLLPSYVSFSLLIFAYTAVSPDLGPFTCYFSILDFMSSDPTMFLTAFQLSWLLSLSITSVSTSSFFL